MRNPPSCSAAYRRFSRNGAIFVPTITSGFAQKLSIRRASRPPESGGQRDPIGSREGRFLNEPLKDAASEPPLARSRLRLDRAALLTEEGEPSFGNDFLCTAPSWTGGVAGRSEKPR